MRLKLQKTRLREAQEDVEARRHNLPPILTSLHSSPLAAPLLMSQYTVHSVDDTVQSDTSGDEIVISSPTTPEPESSSLEIVLDQIISTPRIPAIPLTQPAVIPDNTIAEPVAVPVAESDPMPAAPEEALSPAAPAIPAPDPAPVPAKSPTSIHRVDFRSVITLI